MFEVLMAKFSDPFLRQKLLQTGQSRLVEHTSNDSYWGDGGDGTGHNKLGIVILIEQLKQNQK
jgi:predicted NAD-dependent protein-ADP-ribosyltransferase YbiA (DUF1768 family)